MADFPGGRESTCQCGGHRFDPWSRKIPHAAGQLLSQCSTIREVTAMRNLGTATRGSSCTAMKTQHSQKIFFWMWHPVKKKPKTNKTMWHPIRLRVLTMLNQVRESQYYKRGLLCPGFDFSDHKLKLWPQVLEPLVAFCSYMRKKNN